MPDRAGAGKPGSATQTVFSAIRCLLNEERFLGYFIFIAFSLRILCDSQVACVNMLRRFKYAYHIIGCDGNDKLVSYKENADQSMPFF